MAKAKRKLKVKTPEQQIAATVAERQRLGLGTATVERLIQAGEGGHEHTPATGQQASVQRVTEAPLDRLHRLGFITEAEFDAGDRYRADAYLAAVEPTVGSVDWNSAGGGGRSAKVPSMFGSQAVCDARRRVRAMEARMSGVTRVVATLALVREAHLHEIGQSVFGFRDRKDAAIAGRVATRMACGALVDLYRG
jgi:hypothetical protein